MTSALSVKNLTIGWDDAVLARGVTFDVEEGEIFAILGSSGSGKSTLMRFLVGLEPAREGEIDVAGAGAPDLERGLPPFGVMFQHGALFGSMTTLENVALPLEEWTDIGPEASTAIARAKLRLVGLENAGAKTPDELSGGMKKRAAIARALALDPPIVFLDEPSAGLDPVTAAGLDDLVKTLAEETRLTVVLVTHELESIFRIADRCLMLDKGARGVIAIGTPEELAKSDDARVSDFFNRRPKER
ncbi:MAG TPA: ATP-binding cassette domain-containing protein [Labilithrix sp.]|jgi:phospholipid/cholesterol/gamma-HCH transport system ATP-binding protein